MQSVVKTALSVVYDGLPCQILTWHYKFRKKPVVIEAHQLGNGYDEDLVIMRWCSGKPIPYEQAGEDLALFTIQTKEGALTAREGDWIIKGVQGEFYPCKPDIFEVTYEPVDPVSPVQP
jgi:hypothetical protein